MKIKEIIDTIEQYAPVAYQESYDNSGLLTGNKSLECTGVLICLDAVEAVIEEAIQQNCNFVVAHHPIIFSGLKSLTGKNYIERTIIKAIKNDIAIYAVHTNLDNVHNGVNLKIAQELGLKNGKILSPKKMLLKKLYTYVPEASKEKLLQALFDVGAGSIGNYAECSYSVDGTGTFKGNDQSNPVVGEKNIRSTERESKVEILFAAPLEAAVLNALKSNHPYEEVAYEIIALENDHQQVGSGWIGELSEPLAGNSFLQLVREKMKASCIRHTVLPDKKIEKVAVCGGSGSFLLKEAIRQQADAFITADFKYHQFFDADNKILIADIGHYESEQYTIQLLSDLISKAYPAARIHETAVCTNPVSYFV